jgi:hypothetical protein
LLAQQNLRAKDKANRNPKRQRKERKRKTKRKRKERGKKWIILRARYSEDNVGLEKLPLMIKKPLK